MLSTFTSPISSRRRGGQPRNNNARKHGFYARREPSPALQQFTQIKQLQQSAIFASRSRQLGLAELHVRTLQELLIDNFLAADDIHLGPQTLVKIERFYRTVSATLRAKRALKQLYDELDFLPSLARDVLPLCTAEFTDRRISPYAYYGQANELFVPPLLQKNRALTNVPGSAASMLASYQADGTDNRQPSIDNVPPSTDNCLPTTDHCPPSTAHWFALTSPQWSLLEPVMISLHTQLAEMGIRPRPRVYSDRFLLESILTRLAFGLSWDELRGQIPVRACQLLYKQLCTSGGMRAIYETLYGYLQSAGTTDLLCMSSDGTFDHTADRILLHSGDLPAWEQLTGLLLLQRALYNRRRIKRAEITERHRRRGYERQPRGSSSHNSYRSRARNSTGRHRLPTNAIPLNTGLVSVFDSHKTNPLLAQKLDLISGDPPGESP